VLRLTLRALPRSEASGKLPATSALQKWLANKSCRASVQNMANRKRPAPRYTRGVLAKYAAHVTSASFGAVTDMDLKF
jgi:dihydroxyacid dehydratase/phosphogluconate dehydratase